MIQTRGALMTCMSLPTKQAPGVCSLACFMSLEYKKREFIRASEVQQYATPVKNKLTHIVYYKYQQRSLQR